MEFWKAAKSRFDREVPPDYRMTLQRTSNGIRFYEVTSANYGGTRTYAYISIPEGDGKYPILAQVPPAGPGIWRPAGGKNRISVTVNVHHRRLSLENTPPVIAKCRNLSTYGTDVRVQSRHDQSKSSSLTLSRHHQMLSVPLLQTCDIIQNPQYTEN